MKVLSHSPVMVAHYAPGTAWGPRRMDDYELVWMLTGTAEWTVADGEDREARPNPLVPGSVWLSRPGMREQYVWDRELHSSHAFVHFELMAEAGDPLESEWPLVIDGDEHPAIRGLCEYLLRTRDSSSAPDRPDRRSRVGDVIALIVQLFADGPIPGERPGLPDPVVAAIARIVAEIWARDGVRIIPLDELAARASLSVGHLSRIFSARMHVGVSSALELVRLGRSAIALQRTNLGLEQVAHDIGYATPYHFSRRFRLHYGRSPSEFRAEGWRADPLEPLRLRGLTAFWDATVKVAAVARGQPDQDRA
ncbi:AraC-like DNA-binding protein [Microbacterium sp. SLBN-154]|uniref:helix-turn-helix transcriptional regulator n=1 Tax=Microbacterium sp. SLBN-154 TaxID=2768458 RepID=UPI0011541858|nr:helix-turn-helix transcriptional regulator [Microbacterium sp. SLBN-154]TQK17660.1 AraC-like DNA-binding protein [Microbacterium sp. SLBN-154]